MRWALSLTMAFLLGQAIPEERPDGSWLDRPAEWTIQTPEILRIQRAGSDPKCDPTTRGPVTASERFLREAGWMLNRASPLTRSGGHSIEIVRAFLEFDSECRDLQAQAFVFVDGRLIGTLSPRRMSARTDGSLGDVSLSESGEIAAKFFRYGQSDALCCPSKESVAVYSLIPNAGTYSLKLVRVETRALPQPR